jgi:hypothetical protein
VRQVAHPGRALGAPIGNNGCVAPRPARTRRPRLLPAALLASALVIGTAVTALAATDAPAQMTVINCTNGRDWVVVRPAATGITQAGQWRSASGVTATPAGATVTGCVDLSHLPEQTDSRG